LDGTQSDPLSSPDSEIALLLANIESAIRRLERADAAEDKQWSVADLETALHTYGTVKHLVPKLNLSAAQRAPVEKQLKLLRALIVAHGLYDGSERPPSAPR
jgi:hypothetical protein